ncbi:uncharacterized protein [Mytilus edulis]|uniref:uncharacterized protein n=1 Tax=Mytilus edulis TaxID=6550 RepID=UPI0039F07A05
MSTKTDLQAFASLVTRNDTEGCKEKLLSSQDNTKEKLVNTRIKGFKTVLHIAADQKVVHEIWNLLLPYASEINLYENICKSPLRKIIPYADQEQNNKCFTIGFLRQYYQLNKIRSWLEMTKNETSQKVNTYRNHFLCKLCRLRGSDEVGNISQTDIIEFARELIQTYHTDPNGDSEHRPLLWAMETANLPLLSLFLSFGADANCRDDDDFTPLLYSHCLQGSDASVDIVLLLVKHNADINISEPQGIVTAFHKLLLLLTPEELKMFMKRCSPKVKLSSTCCALPLPPIHGLLVRGLSDSIYRMDKEKMQTDIITKVEILSKYGLDLNQTDLHGRTILHYASWFRFTRLLKFFLNVGGRPFVRDALGRTCLHYSVLHPSRNYKIRNVEEELSVLKLLSENIDKKDLDAQDNYGRRVQHLSLFENNTAALNGMGVFGFDMNVIDNQGKSPLDYDSLNILTNAAFMEQHFKWANNNKPQENELPYSLKTCRTNGSTILYERESVHCESTDVKREDLKGAKLVNLLLHDHNVGPLVISNIERTIFEDVKKLVNKISEHLTEIDKNFQSKIELAGSISEETKILPLDEFDFQFHLIYLSPRFYFDTFEQANEVTLKDIRKDIPVKRDGITDTVHTGESLSWNIYEKFNSFIYTVLNSNDFWKDSPFYWNFLPIAKSVEWIQTNLVVESSLTAPLRLKWIGLEARDLNINIDLVPVIVKQRIPDVVQNLIPSPVTHFINHREYQWHVICRKSDFARLSFLNVERCILMRLMTEVKDAYKLTKSLRSFCDSGSYCSPEIITSYMLKNALFFELDQQLSYGLLNDQLVFHSCYTPSHELALRLMRYNLACSLRNRTGYIHIWALKILHRLKTWFATENCAFVYCRPTVAFPDSYEVRDEYMEHPYIKALDMMTNLLLSK